MSRFAAPAVIMTGLALAGGTHRAEAQSLLRVGSEFHFRGATLITGVVDLAGCTRCTAPAIEDYLAGQV